MIQSVTVTNHVGDTLVMPLARPHESGFIITDISGLGPAKANINMSDYATIDGASYNSSRVEPRNIVITIRLLESPTIEDARHRAYYYFPVKKPIRLRVTTDKRVADIVGYVESNEPNIFSSEEEVVISILCPDPNFYSVKEYQTLFSGSEPAFEFPFSNEGLTPIIEMGLIITNPTRTIYYDGDDDVGATIRIVFSGRAGNISIYNLDSNQILNVDTSIIESILGSQIINRDELVINTRKGSKFVSLIRQGVAYNVLNAVPKTSDWIQLRIGTNTVTYLAESGEENISMSLNYYVAYQGV